MTRAATLAVTLIQLSARPGNPIGDPIRIHLRQPRDLHRGDRGAPPRPQAPGGVTDFASGIRGFSALTEASCGEIGPRPLGSHSRNFEPTIARAMRISDHQCRAAHHPWRRRDGLRGAVTAPRRSEYA